jgi:hypothetical protein
VPEAKPRASRAGRTVLRRAPRGHPRSVTFQKKPVPKTFCDGAARKSHGRDPLSRQQLGAQHQVTGLVARTNALMNLPPLSNPALESFQRRFHLCKRCGYVLCGRNPRSRERLPTLTFRARSRCRGGYGIWFSGAERFRCLKARSDPILPFDLPSAVE